MVIYNGRAALVAGNLAAVLGMALFYFQLLPGYPRTFSIEGRTYEFGPWGFIFGSSDLARVSPDRSGLQSE